jgi:hypothetical protein
MSDWGGLLTMVQTWRSDVAYAPGDRGDRADGHCGARDRPVVQAKWVAAEAKRRIMAPSLVIGSSDSSSCDAAIVKIRRLLTRRLWPNRLRMANWGREPPFRYSQLADRRTSS